jgi:hypothetical protein
LSKRKLIEFTAFFDGDVLIDVLVHTPCERQQIGAACRRPNDAIAIVHSRQHCLGVAIRHILEHRMHYHTTDKRLSRLSTTTLQQRITITRLGQVIVVRVHWWPEPEIKNAGDALT